MPDPFMLDHFPPSPPAEERSAGDGDPKAAEQERIAAVSRIQNAYLEWRFGGYDGTDPLAANHEMEDWIREHGTGGRSHLFREFFEAYPEALAKYEEDPLGVFGDIQAYLEDFPPEEQEAA